MIEHAGRVRGGARCSASPSKRASLHYLRHFSPGDRVVSGPLNVGDVIGGRYLIERYIDEGGMQFVYAARDKLADRVVALKTPKNKSATKRFRRSAIVAAKVNHPNVAKTLDHIRDGDDRYLIEELIVGADLSQALLRKTT